MEIPIGADMSVLMAAFQAALGAMDKFGGTVERRMNQAAGSTQRAMGNIQMSGRRATAGMAGMARSAGVAGVAFGMMRSSAAVVFSSIRSMAERTAAVVRGAFSGLRRVLGGLRIPGLIGGAGALALFASQAVGAVKQAAAFEGMRVSVEHFTGSVAEANRLLGEMAEFGLKTPFETVDLQQTAAALLGAGVRDNVGGIVKDLAAVAKNSEELAGFGDALGKGFAKGKFQTDDLNKFLERQVNLMPALAAQTGLVGDELRKAIEKGLAFEDVTAAIAAMSREGGQFFGLLERRSFTLQGLASTLSSAFADVRKAFGEPILDALRPILTSAIGGVANLLDGAKKLGEAFRDAIGVMFQAFNQGRMMEFLKAGLLLGVLSAVDALQRGFAGAVAFLAATLPPVFEAATAKFRDKFFWQGVAKIFDGLGDGLSARIQEALPLPDQAVIKTLKEFSGQKLRTGAFYIEQAGQGDMGKSMRDALERGSDAWAGAMESFESSPAMRRAQKTFSDMFTSFKAASDEAIEGAKIKSAMMPQAVPAPLLDGAAMDGMGAENLAKAAAPAVLSLTRIGGGGGRPGLGLDRLIGEARNQTRLLKDIVMNTTPIPGRGAVFA